MPQLGRPNKQDAIAISKRNSELYQMFKKGYPRDYIISYFGLTKGRVAQIIKKAQDEESKAKQKGERSGTGTGP